MVSVMSGMLAQAVAVSRRRPQTRTRQATVIAVTPLTVVLDGSDVEITVQENFHGPVQLGQRILVERVGQRWCVDAVPPAPWVTPALLNGWEDWGSSFPPARWRLIPHGIQLQGLIRNGAMGQAVFSVGPGLIPYFQTLHAVTYPGDAGCRVNAEPSGLIVPGTGADTRWVSLSGLIIPT